MNVKIDWRSDFLGICAYDDKILPNHFKVEMQMITRTENPRFQYVAFERMKFLVNDIFGNSIFIGHENPSLEFLGNRYPDKMVLLPEEAYDQVIGVALYCKANAVMEEAIHCQSVRISSYIGDSVWYQFEDGEDMGPYAVATPRRRSKRSSAPWWHRPDILTFDTTSKIEYSTWEDLLLGWEEDSDEPVEETVGEIIDMKKKKKKFHGEVVNGGKPKDED